MFQKESLIYIKLKSFSILVSFLRVEGHLKGAQIASFQNPAPRWTPSAFQPSPRC